MPAKEASSCTACPMRLLLPAATNLLAPREDPPLLELTLSKDVLALSENPFALYVLLLIRLRDV